VVELLDVVEVVDDTVVEVVSATVVVGSEPQDAVELPPPTCSPLVRTYLMAQASSLKGW
jgi:hypothetical protein